MSLSNFITINQTETLSLADAFRLLQRSGELDGFISGILKQYVLERELQTNPAVAIPQTDIEQQVLTFRKENELLDSFAFQDWLESEGLDMDLFYAQIANELGIQKLQEHLAEGRLQEYFIERKLFLDRVILSRIVVEESELAAELYSQLVDGASFEGLAREYSLTEDRYMNGMFGFMARGSLPDTLRAMLDVSVPGSVLEPLELEGNWYIFRYEHTMPATLDDPTIRQALLDELLERWLMQTLQSLSVDIQVDGDSSSSA